MSVLTSAIITHLKSMLDDPNGSKWTAAQYLAVVNGAIEGGWPTIKNTQVDSSKTIASTTFEYTPTATPPLETGFANAYVTLTSNPKVMLRGVKQRLSTTTWTIYLSAQTALNWSGETLHLEYNSRVAQVTATTDTIEMPFDYLWNAAAAQLCALAMTRSSQRNTDPYERLVVVYRQDAARALKAARRGDLVQTIKTVAEFGVRQAAGEMDWFTTP